MFCPEPAGTYWYQDEKHAGFTCWLCQETLEEEGYSEEAFACGKQLKSFYSDDRKCALCNETLPVKSFSIYTNVCDICIKKEEQERLQKAIDAENVKQECFFCKKMLPRFEFEYSGDSDCCIDCSWKVYK